MTFFEYSYNKCIKACEVLGTLTPFWSKQEDVFRENSWRSWMYACLCVVFAGFVIGSIVTLPLIAPFVGFEKFIVSVKIIWTVLFPILLTLFWLACSFIFLCFTDMDKAEW